MSEERTFHDVGAVDDFKTGNPKVVRVLDVRVAVFRTADALYALKGKMVSRTQLMEEGRVLLKPPPPPGVPADDEDDDWMRADPDTWFRDKK